MAKTKKKRVVAEAQTEHRHAPTAAALTLTAGQVEVWDEQVWEDAPLYIDKDLKNRVTAAVTGPANYGLREFVSDVVEAANVSDEELKPEERERLRRCGEILRAVVADVEKMLTKKDQSDRVRKFRLKNKLWQFGGLIFEIAGYRGGRSITINDRIRAALATKGRKRKSRGWHDIIDPLAAIAWRNGPDYPDYKPYRIAASIKNKVNVKEDTIGHYLSKNEARIKSFG